MTMTRSAALGLAAGVAAGFAGPAAAATCNLTVLGAHVLDDAACSVATARGVTRIAVADGSALLIRRSTMSARLAGDVPTGPRVRRRFASYGQVVVTDDADDRRCYFNQKATLCVEP